MPQKSITPRQEIILMALSGTELFGQQVAESVQVASGGGRRLLSGSLYPALNELEGAGMIASRSGSRTKKYYRLTEVGEKALAEIQQFRAALIEWRGDTAYYPGSRSAKVFLSPEAEGKTSLISGSMMDIHRASGAIIIEGWRFESWAWNGADEDGGVVYIYDGDPQRVEEVGHE